MKTNGSSRFRVFSGGIIVASILLYIAVSTCSAESWGKTYHGPWGDWWTSTTIRNFIVTSDGGYALVGTSNGYGVLLKLMSDGTIAWSKVFARGFESNTTEFAGIVETADGGYAVTGQAYVDTATGGTGGWDVYVVRLNSSGTMLWERVYGRLQAEGQEHPTFEYGKRIYENADGSFTVTGTVLFSHIGEDCPYHGYESGLILNISPEGALQSHYVVAGSYAGGPKNEVYKTGNGGYVVGITHSFESLGYTLNLQRYSATGGLEWSQAYYNIQGETNQRLSEHSIAEVADGYLVATTTNFGRYHLFKVDPTGTILWRKQYKIYGNENSAYPIQIVETADDGTIIALHSAYSTVDQVILKTDGTGDMEWSNSYDGHSIAIARSAGDGFAVATSDFNFVFARLNGSGVLDKRCAALPTSAGDTTEEVAPTAVVIPGKGPITCNEAVTAGTWASGVPQPSLLTASDYHQVDACIPKLTVSPSPVSFYDTRVGLTSTANVGLSNYYGLGDITLGQLSLTDPTNFAIQADGCSGQTISYVNFAPHPTGCALQVVFTPKSKGLKIGSLTIPSDDPGGPTTVEVRGTGYVFTYGLTLSATPSGKGSVIANPPGTVFDEGTVVTLTAEPGAGYHFDHWEGGITGSANPSQITITGHTSVTATFEINSYVLTANSEGTGSGSLAATGLSCTGSTCSGTYTHGTSVVITATPEPGSRIDSFNNCDSVSGTSCTVNMISAKAVSATFTAISVLTVTTTGDGSGIVASDIPGISCPGDCTETYLKSTVVTLTATPDPSSYFAYYTGGCNLASPTCPLTLAADTSVSVTFVSAATKKVNLTVSKTKTNRGDGTVTSTDGRINCGGDCKDPYYPGSPVTLKATPNEVSVFSGWSKECPSPDGDTCTLTIEKALTVKAIFIGPYTMKVQKTAKNKGTGTVTSTDGKINCGADCAESYPYNTTVTLNAAPNVAPDSLSVFTSWSGCTPTDTPTCTVTMDKVKTVKATFTGPSLLKITITSKNKGTGTVTSDPPGITCAIGSTACSQPYLYQSPVTLTALPDPGSNFVSFSGCAIVSGTTCTVTMDKAKTVRATFEKPKTTAGPDRIEVYGEKEGEED